MAEKKKTITVPLEEPVEIAADGETAPRRFTELTLRRMKARDALVADGEQNQTRAGYMLFAALAGVPVAVIEELDMDDLAAVGEAAAELMGKQALEMLNPETTTASPGATS